MASAELAPAVTDMVLYRAQRFTFRTLAHLDPEIENEYDDVPALIVRVCAGLENVVNLQVFFDNPDGPKWLTMIRKGDKIGQWRWPD